MTTYTSPFINFVIEDDLVPARFSASNIFGKIKKIKNDLEHHDLIKISTCQLFILMRCIFQAINYLNLIWLFHKQQQESSWHVELHNSQSFLFKPNMIMPTWWHLNLTLIDPWYCPLPLDLACWKSFSKHVKKLTCYIVTINFLVEGSMNRHHAFLQIMNIHLYEYTSSTDTVVRLSVEDEYSYRWIFISSMWLLPASVKTHLASNVHWLLWLACFVCGLLKNFCCHNEDVMNSHDQEIDKLICKHHVNH